jgi:hypothetical protein
MPWYGMARERGPVSSTGERYSYKVEVVGSTPTLGTGIVFAMNAEMPPDPDDEKPECTKYGWYWYCDVHDTHGNADREAEAQFVSDAHAEYWELDDPDDDPCDIVIIALGAAEYDYSVELPEDEE